LGERVQGTPALGLSAKSYAQARPLRRQENFFSQIGAQGAAYTGRLEACATKEDIFMT
jgi:hypothetical protein